jgi:tetratricopeptide (TPR) repeat protein
MGLITLALGGPGESFEAGNAAIAAEDFPAAVEAYREALALGGIDSDVYYNLGNALYRQNEIPLAILAWRRASSLAPRDPDARANLEFARKRVRERLAVTPGRPWFAPWQAALTPLEGAWLGGLAGGAGLFLLAMRARWAGVTSPAVALLVVGALLGLGGLAAARLPKHAVVLPPEVRATSDLGGGVDLFTLSAGAEVVTEETAAGKTLLRLPDGRRGWVDASALGLVDPASPFPVL